MAKRRQYPYEGDPLGKRQKKYFPEDRIGIDSPNIQTFTALRIKLFRDYLGFFRGLALLHKEGEVRKLTVRSVQKTMEVISVLDFAIARNVLDKKDIDKVIEKVNELNEVKDVLLQQSQENERLQVSMRQVEEATGISPEDLSVTEKRVRRGIRREVKRGREGIISRLERGMPRTIGYGADITRGLAAAALGPFYPMMKMGAGFLRDIYGVGKGIATRAGERRERRFEQELIPSAYSTTTEDVSRIAGMRGYGAPVTRYPGHARKETINAFRDFFDREAYRAKWTKELLQEIKGFKKKERKEGGLFNLFGLGDKFKLLAAGILPLLGKAGLLAGTGIAIGWTIGKFNELGTALANYNDAMKRTHKVYTEGLNTLEARWKMIKEIGIEKVAAAAGTTPKGVVMEQVSSERRMEFAEQLTKGTWWDQFKRRLKASYTPQYETKWGFWPSGIKKPEKGMDFYKEVEERKREAMGTPAGAPQVYNVPPEFKPLIPKGYEAIEEAINNLAKREVEKKSINEDVANAMKLLTSELRRERSPISIREPGLGDSSDSGDSLLRAHAAGNLTIRE